MYDKTNIIYIYTCKLHIITYTYIYIYMSPTVVASIMAGGSSEAKQMLKAPPSISVGHGEAFTRVQPFDVQNTRNP